VVEAEARQDLIGRRLVGHEPRGEAEDANGYLRVDGTNPISDHHPDPAGAHPVLDRDHRCVARRIDELSASSGAQQRASHSVTSTPPTFELFDGALGGGDELAESH
jgi:hypothetical protein